MNKGKFLKDKYFKQTNWNNAVFWSKRQISLPVDIFERIVKENIPLIQFKDKKTGDLHNFKTSEVIQVAEKKKEYQETQYYWDIDLQEVEINFKDSVEVVPGTLTNTQEKLF